jgi:hypothetical protein
MKNYGFKKTTLRNDFTVIFGGVGKRRYIFIDKGRRPVYRKRTRMQMYRRAAQGWRNKVFGRLTAMKLRLEFGIRKPATRFRR